MYLNSWVIPTASEARFTAPLARLGLAAEGEQGFRHVVCLTGCLLDSSQSHRGRMPVRQTLADLVGRSPDDDGQVLDVVGDPIGHHAEGLHLLHL